MDPAEHLAWTSESVDWLLALPAGAMETPVGNCPGWTIGTLFDHLARGLGRGYRAMVEAPPDSDALSVMVSALGSPTSGADAHALFATVMPEFVDVLCRIPADQPCATYAGPGIAAFWRRKTAVELAVHGTDVADAIGSDLPIEPARGLDGVDETLTFAIPFAFSRVGKPAGTLRLRSGKFERAVGEGSPVVTVDGTPAALLLGLYGRRTPDISGNQDLAREWLTLIGRAF